MTPWTKLGSMAAIALAVSSLAAGCGGSQGAAPYGGSSGTGYSRTPPVNRGAHAASTSVATIAVEHSPLGPILDNGQGRTVYLFEKDSGTASTCYGACAGIWTPVTTTGAPRAGSGATAAELGTSKRRDGTLQLTYGDHPLYTYAGDAGPAQTNGQGLDEFGARWYVVTPAGSAVQSGGQ
jgi:predicted lipoprotein with Yx(FWY)xxD motif